MLSASQIKYVKSLQKKKFRDIHNAFVAEGEKILSELPYSSLKVEAIFASPNWMETNRGAFDSKTPIYAATSKDLERISGLKTPSSVVAVIKKPLNDGLLPVDNDEYILALDSIQDPGNLGTILRTADWFGIRHIVCSNETADFFNPKVIQATMGSFARVRVLYLDLVEFIKDNSIKRTIFGATLRGETLYDCKAGKGSIIVIGNESRGISNNILPLLTKEIKIPRGPSTETAESLNAAVAAGIMMAWVRKTI